MQIINIINTNIRRLIIESNKRFIRLDRIQLQNGLFIKNAKSILLMDLMVLKNMRT
jgi:hypothetical protein